MPDFYTKGVKLKKGLTYAVRGGDPGYTSDWFKDGACALDAFNAFMIADSQANTPLTGETVNLVFAGSNKGITFSMYYGQIYPFRLRVLGIPAGNNDIIGLA